MIRRLLVCAVVLAVVLSLADRPVVFAADKAMLELQRQVAELQELIQAQQKGFDERLAAMAQKQGDQGREQSEQTAKLLGAFMDRLQKGFQEQQEQQNKSAGTIAALNARLDEQKREMEAMREELTALGSTAGKLSTQISGVQDTVKVMCSAPAAAPPDPNVPAISAVDLLGNAERDRLGGNFDLALNEYADFLKYYPKDAQAPNALYRIGWIQYSSNHFTEAVAAYERLLQDYPDDDHAAESLYYKGMSLRGLDRWPEATDTFKQLRTKFATHELAKKSLTIRPAAKR